MCAFLWVEGHMSCIATHLALLFPAPAVGETAFRLSRARLRIRGVLDRARIRAPRRHLDLDLDALLEEPGLDHRRRRAHLAEVAAEHRHALLEVLAARQDIAHAHDILDRGAALRERGDDV